MSTIVETSIERHSIANLGEIAVSTFNNKYRAILGLSIRSLSEYKIDPRPAFLIRKARSRVTGANLVMDFVGLDGLQDGIARCRDKRRRATLETILKWAEENRISSELWSDIDVTLGESIAASESTEVSEASQTEIIDDQPTVTGWDGTGSPFDVIKRYDQHGREYWSARDLMPRLGYTKWQNMVEAIQRAKTCCLNSGKTLEGNFTDTSKITDERRGPNASDCHLSRYACYLVAMNGEPSKPEIAAAQSYFAARTHQAEQAEKAMPELTGIIQALAAMTALHQSTNTQVGALVSETAALKTRVEQVAATAAQEAIQAVRPEIQAKVAAHIDDAVTKALEDSSALNDIRIAQLDAQDAKDAAKEAKSASESYGRDIELLKSLGSAGSMKLMPLIQFVHQRRMPKDIDIHACSRALSTLFEKRYGGLPIKDRNPAYKPGTSEWFKQDVNYYPLPFLEEHYDYIHEFRKKPATDEKQMGFLA